jgi:protein-arginine kinase activator protein McsA
LSALLKGSRVGCPNCYEHFGSTIKHLVASAQKMSNPMHVGMVPDQHKMRSAEKEDLTSFLAELNHEADTALKGERYEEVPRLRAKIKEFEEAILRYRSQVLIDETVEDESERRAPSIRRELAKIIVDHREGRSSQNF